MPLTLKVLSFKGQPVLQTPVIITEQGGSIGRSEENNLVLPDPEKFVSRKHATIHHQNGQYYLTDCSLSGVFINDQEQALNNDSQQLFDGMRLHIGEYEIAISIEQINLPFSYNSAKIDSTSDFFLPSNDFINPLMTEQSLVKHEQLAGTDSFQPGFESQLDHASSPLFDSFTPPQINNRTASFDAIPENFSFEDLLAETQAKAQKNQTKTPTENTTSTVASTPELFDAFLQGAGMHHYQPVEAASTSLYRVGQMFRQLLDGMITLLRHRASFKSSSRLDMTMIQNNNNNPLKFTITADDVLRKFLDNNKNGFLDSVEAIDQGFDDITNHQIAMRAGIEAAIADLVEAFNPERIEKQIEQGIILQKKAKCWDKYEEIYHYIKDIASENFFGEAFAEAYQQKIHELEKRHRR